VGGSIAVLLVHSIALSYAFADRVFLPLHAALPENMSRLEWKKGRWKPFGKDLETALQSEEAQACSE
jgi:hypothetical protein